MAQHCEGCGNTNPVDNGEGYTDCCNELFCDGRDRDKFGTPENYVIACCWAKAEEIFAEREQKVPDGSCRLDG
jgi:hypothetical protein